MPRQKEDNRLPNNSFSFLAKATITEFGYMMDNGATNQYVIGTGYKDLKDVAQIK